MLVFWENFRTHLITMNDLLPFACLVNMMLIFANLDGSVSTKIITFQL